MTADTSGSPEVTRSECPDTGECGAAGRVELVHFIADVEGQYRFRVYPFASDPNNGKGGSFDLEISMGAAGSVIGGNTPPTADFTATCNDADLVCSFTDASSDPDGSVASWSWDFGGTGSADLSDPQNPTFAYDTAGSYTVTLTVADNEGAEDSAAKLVTPGENLAPTASFTFSTSNLTVSFTDTSEDSDGSIASWSWDFGDTTTSTSQNPSHTYASGGTYNVTLQVMDNEGETASVTQSVTVTEPQAPTASFDISSNPCGEGEMIDNRCSFYDTSTDSDGEIVTWDWDFGGGTVAGGIPCCPGHEMLVDFPADGPNPETVSLTVTDDDGATHTATMEVFLSAPADGNTAPTATIDAPTDGATFTVGDSVAFSGSANDTEDGDLTSSLSWTSSLDGAIGSGGSFSTSSLSAGGHTISASVTDSGGLSGGDSITLNIEDVNTAPTVTITAPADGTVATEGDLVSFTGTAEDSEDGDIKASLVWTSDLDGQIGTGGGFSIDTLSVGTHTVTAAVSDSGGLSGQDSISIEVASANNTAPVVSISAPTSGSSFTVGDPITFTGSASDTEEGDITASLVWTSNLDGQIGTGGSFATTLTIGTHTVTASATDSGGLSDTETTTVTVVPISAHIGDLDGEGLAQPRNRWQADVYVLVLDGSGSPVENAVVDGTWSGGASGSGTCTTDGTGWCLITKGDLKSNVSSATFTVENIGGTDITYDSSANVDPDGGSYGADEHIIDVLNPDASSNEAPAATISSPSDGASFASGESIAFSGTATDAEDGDVTASLVWTSDLDGQIGTGGSFSAALGDGAHTITATATDSDGATGDAQVAISVGDTSSGSSISLTANGYKVQGVHTVDLSWSGVTEGNVDIWRNDAFVVMVPYDNDGGGSYTDSTGNKGGGSYDYKVCKADTSTCSNVVTVTF